MKHIFHTSSNILRLLLRLFHLRADSQRDTDFLGYEAYSSLNMVTYKALSQGKVDVIDKNAEFAGSRKVSLPLKAA